MFDFSTILKDLKGGHTAWRTNWNGKGMYIFLVKPFGAIASHHEWELHTRAQNQDEMKLRPFIAMKTADNQIVPWIASQTDLLENDWYSSARPTRKEPKCCYGGVFGTDCDALEECDNECDVWKLCWEKQKDLNSDLADKAEAKEIEVVEDIPLTMKEYQARAITTALPTSLNMPYMTLGLAGEAGEVANKAKKVIRDGTVFDPEDLAKELGDILWYLACLAYIHNITLEDIGNKNLKKLADRKARGVLSGSGDNR